MNSVHTRLFSLAVAFAVVAAGPEPALGQEAAFSNLIGKKAYFAVSEALRTIDETATQLFEPTTISCPGGNGACVVRVQLSAEVIAIPPGGAVFARARVDGYQIAPGTITFSSNTSASSAYGTNTFTWVVGGVSPGSHTVTVEMLGPGSPRADERTLAVDVYKP